jgi:putative ABC transport system permease protein
MYVEYELSYDRYNTKSKCIYRLTEMLHLPKEDRPQAVTSPPMAPALKNNCPEIEQTVRINTSSRILSYQQKKLYGTKIIYADSTLFDIFTFPILKGDPQKALVNPYSIVVTESAAKKYFGNEPALGKVMQLSDTINLTVTGVVKDVPSNSHFTFDVVLSRTTIDELNQHQPETNWFNNGYYTYILLRENASIGALRMKANAFIEKQMADERKNSGLWYNFTFTPLRDIHLHSNISSEINPNSDISYVYIFSAAAILILLIACCNFVNLSTARSLNRAKEIGLRKVAGAKKIQLISQFLSESILFATFAGALAVLTVALVLPVFNSFTGKTLVIHYTGYDGLLFVCVCIIFCAGLLAGFYPALLMSSFAPITSLKGVIRHGWQDIILRKGLVIFQFTIAIILIAGTTLVLQQMKFVQNRKLGLNKDQVIEIGLRSADVSMRDALLKELGKIRSVTDITFTDFSFKSGISNIAVLPEGAHENEITSQAVISVDEHFFKTFQLQLVEGRNFSHSFPTDPDDAFIVNEKAVQLFGWNTPKNAIGKKMDWGLGKKGKVIGVVKDFNFRSLHENINPLIIHILPDWYRFVAIKIRPANMQQTLTDLEKTWKTFTHDRPFDYSFLDEDFANLYKDEQHMQTVLGAFTLLSVGVACLGLFGLAAFSIKQRMREIAVRKVLGASVGSITRLLSIDILQLVAISSIIAIPIAWWAVYSWLQDFAYKVTIGWWIFPVAGLVAVLIALLTVSWQAIRAATSNPVKNLRTE